MPPRDVRRAVGVGAIITIASIFFTIFPVWVWLQIDPVIRVQDIYVSCIVLPALISPTCSFIVLRAQIRAERLAAENDRLANHDELTGLPNRRAFFARAGEMMAGAHRSTDIFVCAIADIDNFKRINDGFGHSAGDSVIRAVASLLEGRGMAARIGGEEFAIWMPRTSIEDARPHAEKLRHELMSLKVIELADDYRITASFGVAPCGRDIPLSQAMIAADRALYEAKNSGRNRVCIGNASRPAPKREPVPERAAA